MRFDEALRSAKGHHSRGELLKAIAEYARALEQDPAQPEAWHLKGLAEHQSGRLADALASVRRAIATGGEQPSYLLLEGDILHDQGDLDGAEKRFGRVVDLAPAWPAGHLALGRVRMDRGRFEEALQSFQAVSGADPTHARAWNNAGVALECLERFDEASAAFQRAVALDPRYALAQLNLARLLDARDSRGALEHVELALRANPRLAEGWLILHGIHRRAFALDHALAAVDSGLRVATGDIRLLNARAELLAHMGRVEDSREAFVDLSRRFPASLKAALGASLTLPRVYTSREHLERSRRRYGEGLRALDEASDRFRFETPAAALGEASWVNFYLAYQGAEDRELQRAYGEFLQGVLRPRLPEFFERRERVPRARIRVGFLSHFFFNCVVGRYFSSWITDLDPGRFEVFVYYSNETMADDTRRVAAAAGTFRHVAGRPLPSIARQVIADELDVLVYPELGMHPETFALAALRLAPVQCAAWGHPTTPGLPAIDWYLSPGEMEPENAERHYAEKLARLPGLGTRYAMPQGDSREDRAALGIPENRNAYLVPQSLFKIHPDNDELIARVLERDPDGVAVMFPSSQEALTRIFSERLSRALAARRLDFRERVHFLKFVPHSKYLRINAVCDVMLDTLHWSGGNTTLDALACGLPVVTLPGPLMRGRQSAAMLRRVGVPDLVARDVEDYVACAARLGRSPEERRALSARIVEGRGELFERPEAVRVLEAFLEREARSA